MSTEEEIEARGERSQRQRSAQWIMGSQKTDRIIKTATCPLFGGRQASIEFPYPLSEQEWEFIMQWFDLMGPVLVSPEIVKCEDCGKPYDKFPLDVVLPNEQWELITGYKDGEGILCASCILERGARLKTFTVAILVFE